MYPITHSYIRNIYRRLPLFISSVIFYLYSPSMLAQNCQLSIVKGSQIECEPNTLVVESSPSKPLLTSGKENSRTSHSSQASLASATLTSNPTKSQDLSLFNTNTNTSTTDSLNNPVVPSPVKPTLWEIRLQDITLAQTLSRWSQQAGWKLLWDVDRHIMIDSPHQIEGSFEKAITQLLSAPSFLAANLPLEVCFYPNTPPLARITRKGEQAKECI